jgi:hypothetical protein
MKCHYCDFCERVGGVTGGAAGGVTFMPALAEAVPAYFTTVILLQDEGAAAIEPVKETACRLRRRGAIVMIQEQDSRGDWDELERGGIINGPWSSPSWFEDDTFGTSLAFLQRKRFPPLKYVVNGLVPEGLTLLAERPKIGKSWSIWDILLGVTGERFALGDYRCKLGQRAAVGAGRWRAGRAGARAHAAAGKTWIGRLR